MTWVKIDDQFPDHPKVAAAGIEASWLHICGLAYCARYLTNGLIPAAVLRRLSEVKSPRACADKLIEVGLWEETEEGFMIHDYLEYNPSADQVKHNREVRSQSGKTGGMRSGEKRSKVPSKDEANCLGFGSDIVEAKSNPVPYPSRPLPNSNPLPPKNDLPKTDNSQPFDMDEDPFADRVIPLRSAEGKRVFDEMMAEIMHKANEDVQGYRHEPDMEIERAQFVSLEGKVLTVYMNTTYHDPDYYEGLIGRRATRTRCWGGYQFRVLMPPKVATA